MRKQVDCTRWHCKKINEGPPARLVGGGTEKSRKVKKYGSQGR
jgi:hypothetical protein